MRHENLELNYDKHQFNKLLGHLEEGIPAIINGYWVTPTVNFNIYRMRVKFGELERDDARQHFVSFLLHNELVTECTPDDMSASSFMLVRYYPSYKDVRSVVRTLKNIIDDFLPLDIQLLAIYKDLVVQTPTGKKVCRDIIISRNKDKIAQLVAELITMHSKTIEQALSFQQLDTE